MHAILLTAALAVGSGDGHDGATDGRMVEKVPPYAQLRVGMNKEDAKKLMRSGSTAYYAAGDADQGVTYCYKCGPDWLGQCFIIFVKTKNDRVTWFKVHPIGPESQ
jgi:hypothetical protein